MSFDPAWQPLTADASHAALFLDFDGTLAPIVPDPAAAAPLARVVHVLGQLARRMPRVAIVTGRPVEFVRAHVVDGAVAVVGQYGLERDVGGRTEVDPRAAAYEDAVAGAAAEAAGRWPRLTVERKGRVAVTVHWRTAPGAAPADDELAALAQRWGLARVPGRLACELRPPLAVDKGTAVEGLLAECDVRAVAFVGDDHGDLAAFVAVGDWARRERGRTGVRVAIASDESPPALIEAADLVLDGPAALAADLVAIADVLG